MSKVAVALTPLLYENYEDPNSIVVVIDVLRATSAISSAFETGVKSIIPVESIENAREWKAKGYLVGAERNGEKIEEFDFGNSPYDYMDSNLKGKDIVLTTTNGTRAFKMASKEGFKVVSASFVNLTAVSEWLIKQDRDVVIICSGWKGRYNLEDSMCAGAIVDIISKHPQFDDYSDSALASKYLYQVAKEDTFKFLRTSSHSKRMQRLNMKEDIRYSLTPDQSKIIPILNGDRLVPLEA